MNDLLTQLKRGAVMQGCQGQGNDQGTDRSE